MAVRLALLTLREEHWLRVVENRVLREIFGPKRDEVAGHCKRLHDDELYDLHPSPNIIPVINSRTITWAGCMARMGDREVHVRFWWEHLGERDHLEDLGVDGKVIIKWIFKTYLGRYGQDYCGSG
jgi:hypothetical protein